MIDKSVLIIDDELRMTESLRDLLAAYDYDVGTANSGEEGLAALEAKPYPVVVTDLRMQGLDGLQVIRHVHENLPKTLVIVITGYASTESAIEAVHYQAFDYLRKPFEFEQLKASIERAFNQLEVDQLREDTAAMITHDIKGPLTSILGFAQLLYDDVEGTPHARGPEFAGKIRSNAQRILSLVDNYLASCKIDAGSFTVHTGSVQIAHLLGELAETIATEAERRGFRLEIEPDPDPEQAELDENYIFRALANLLQNAVKYGDPAEPIRLNVRRITTGEGDGVKESLQFEVVNLAPGAHPEMLEGLFGRFTRAAEDSGIEGSGIGLYVVDAVARAHGGTAEAKCLDAGRVSFSITLPIDMSADG